MTVSDFPFLLIVVFSSVVVKVEEVFDHVIYSKFGCGLTLS